MTEHREQSPKGVRLITGAGRGLGTDIAKAALRAGHAAVATAATRVDVLVNHAGNFYAGFFEEITPQDFRNQIETITPF